MLVIARLAPQKGLHDLLDAAGMLEEPDSIRIKVAGDGPLHDELEARIRREQLPVELLGRRHDVPELLAACDLVGLPPRTGRDSPSHCRRRCGPAARSWPPTQVAPAGSPPTPHTWSPWGIPPRSRPASQLCATPRHAASRRRPPPTASARAAHGRRPPRPARRGPRPEPALMIGCQSVAAAARLRARTSSSWARRSAAVGGSKRLAVGTFRDAAWASSQSCDPGRERQRCPPTGTRCAASAVTQRHLRRSRSRGRPAAPPWWPPQCAAETAQVASRRRLRGRRSASSSTGSCSAADAAASSSCRGPSPATFVRKPYGTSSK